jgi:hypothetical protein
VQYHLICVIRIWIEVVVEAGGQERQHQEGFWVVQASTQKLHNVGVPEAGQKGHLTMKGVCIHCRGGAVIWVIDGGKVVIPYHCTNKRGSNAHAKEVCRIFTATGFSR